MSDRKTSLVTLIASKGLSALSGGAVALERHHTSTQRIPYYYLKNIKDRVHTTLLIWLLKSPVLKVGTISSLINKAKGLDLYKTPRH